MGLKRSYLSRHLVKHKRFFRHKRRKFYKHRAKSFRRFKRPFRHSARRLKFYKAITKNPFGDGMSIKLKFLGSAQYTIAPAATYKFGVIRFNNLAAVLGDIGGSSLPGWSTFEFSNVVNPPGFNTWLNMFKYYRINGCKMKFICENEGSANDTGALTTTYTPYIAVGYEAQKPTTTSPIVPEGPGLIGTYDYWQMPELINNRWTNYKVMGQAGASNSKVKISRYVSAAQLWPDRVSRLQLNQGPILPTTGTLPAPAFGSTQINLFGGFVIGNLNGKPNVAGTTSYFSVYTEITLYAQIWDKTATSNIP